VWMADGPRRCRWSGALFPGLRMFFACTWACASRLIRPGRSSVCTQSSECILSVPLRVARRLYESPNGVGGTRGRKVEGNCVKTVGGSVHPFRSLNERRCVQLSLSCNPRLSILNMFAHLYFLQLTIAIFRRATSESVLDCSR